MGHFLRATAAAIPPAMSPTAVAAIPMPIAPSTFKPKGKNCQLPSYTNKYYIYIYIYVEREREREEQ